ncbi:MAG: hypothetical protein V1752_01530 [Candidatus Firestonebacteria bacterium]
MNTKPAKETEMPLAEYFTVKEREYFRQLKKAIKLGRIFLAVITLALFVLACYNFKEAVKLGSVNNLPFQAILRIWLKGLIYGYFYSESKVRILNLVSTAFMNLGFVAIIWMFYYFIRREEQLLSKCWSVITGEHIKENKK